MSFSIIAAIAKNGVIGNNNKLPWYIPEDLEFFYKIVSGKPVVMGRKTYESLGRAIAKSENIVLSHEQSLLLPGCMVMHSFAEVLARYRDATEEIMIIGGASIYEYFLPLANKMYLTLIDSDVVGDVYFPKWQEAEWVVVDKRSSSFGKYSYSFVTLQRK